MNVPEICRIVDVEMVGYLDKQISILKNYSTINQLIISRYAMKKYIAAYVSAENEGSFTVTELMEQLDLSQATASHSLTALLEKGVIRFEKFDADDGRRRRYLLNKDSIVTQNEVGTFLNIIDDMKRQCSLDGRRITESLNQQS